MAKAIGSKHKPGDVTALQVQRFKGPGKLKIGAGLYLVVTPTGNRRWVYRFTFAGKPSELFLGPEGRLTLAEARARCAEAKALVDAGKDPRHSMNAAARRAKQAKTAGVPAFGDLADDYIDSLEPTFKNEKARQPWELSLVTYAAAIRKMPVNAVTTAHIADLLKPIWHTKPETARRVRWRVEAVFSEAIARGHRDKNPDGELIVQRNPASWKDNLDRTSLNRRKATKQLVKHHPSMPFKDVPAFLTELRSRESLAARALELCILTATRTAEVSGARWAEFDLKDGTWTIAAERMKAGREHVIPLSAPALAVVKALPRYEGSPFVFPGLTGDKHLSNMSMAMLLRRMGREMVTVHGFRSTFRDWAAETTQFPAEVAEMALAHTIASKVERAYRRGDLFEKRKKLMAAWANYCGAECGSNVIVMR
ncbi:tyrosine-type recombinase/integrase [Aestuariivirga sp.]|uniref:tyrosine-type recombinase/integrase n=1 Tax=Aestuariivirga sp. TaxID=2650926 RepID=UPI0039E4CBB8